MHAPFTALSEALRDLSSVVRQLSVAEYTRPARADGSGSVGAHVRHCLDHVTALERGIATGLVDYDQRIRLTAIETDPMRALDAIAEISARLAGAGGELAEDSVSVSTQVMRAAPPLVVGSTIGRELAFVISHTIHHSATIAVLLRTRGRRLPRPFGVAPSTPIGPELPCALSA
jgi:uncharacterized damage-inducible protein DinB